MAKPSFKRNSRRESFTVNNYNKNNQENVDLIFTARVVDVNINKNSRSFKSRGNGSYGNIGGIKCVTAPYNTQAFKEIFALPYLPFIKYYPLVGEAVLIVKGPIRFNNDNLNESYYYLPSYNIFNNPSLNTIADYNFLFKDIDINTSLDNSELAKYNIEGNQARNIYKDNEAGITYNPQKNIKKEFDPNPSNQFTFVEKPSNPLHYYPGDLIFEGRYGNSIRFGATADDGTNSWSQDGDNGEPITIINNGRNKVPGLSQFDPISENPNTDISSIYLTSNQKLPIKIQDPNLFSTKTRPDFINIYNKPQIVLNSNRILFNAKSDSIIGIASKTINFKAKEFGIVSKNQAVIQSSDIRLGNNQAEEPLLLGNKTIQMLEELLTSLQSAFENFKSISDWPGGVSVPNTEVIAATVDMVEQIKQIRSRYLGSNPSITSNTTRTT